MDPILDASPGDLVQAIEDSFRGWLPVFEQLEDARLEYLNGCVRWTSAIRLPLFNGVIGVPTGGDLGPAVDEVLAPFNEGDIPLLWLVPPSGDLTAQLQSRGFEVEHPAGMTIDLSVLPPVRPIAGVSIREVDDDADALEVATRIALTTNGLPEDAAPSLVEALHRFAERTRVHTFLATMDEAPVASGTLFEWAGVAGLYNVGTLPEFRGRGLGRLVSLAAMEAGRVDGYRFSVLQASAMGEPVYRSIGFEERCRFTFAVRGPRDAAEGHAT